MLLEAKRRFGLDLQRSILVGDKRTDAEAGYAAGVSHLYVLGREEVVKDRFFTSVEDLRQVMDVLGSLD